MHLKCKTRIMPWNTMRKKTKISGIILRSADWNQNVATFACLPFGSLLHAFVKKEAQPRTASPLRCGQNSHSIFFASLQFQIIPLLHENCSDKCEIPKLDRSVELYNRGLSIVVQFQRLFFKVQIRCIDVAALIVCARILSTWAKMLPLKELTVAKSEPSSLLFAELRWEVIQQRSAMQFYHDNSATSRFLLQQDSACNKVVVESRILDPMTLGGHSHRSGWQVELVQRYTANRRGKNGWTKV